MVQDDTRICWYAARTRYGQEIGVRDRLQSLGVENFIPTTRARNYRGKMREKPVINNLVFLRTTKGRACDLKVFYGLPLNFMNDAVSHSMLVVPDKQMEDFIKVFQVSDTEGGLLKDTVTPGEKVRVISGPLIGVEGQVLELAGEQYLIVGLCGLVYARTKIPRSCLEKM